MGTIISWPDFTLTATVTASGFQTTAPITNIQDPNLGKLARITGATATIYIDLGEVQSVQCLGILNHNLSYTGDDTAGRIRIQGYSDSGYTTAVSGADTGICYVWPQSGFSAREAREYPNNFITVLAAAVGLRYVKATIADDANAVGYLQFGRLYIGESRFAPDIGGPAYGMSLGFESRDVIENDIPAYGSKRTPRRSQVMTFKALNPDEKREALIMQKILTQVDEALFITNTGAEAKDMLLEAYPCFISEADALTYPYANNNEMGLKIIERTA